MTKKVSSSETVNLERVYRFGLTPMEFIAMEWVYRKEIKPAIANIPELIYGKELDAGDVFYKIRRGIEAGLLSDIQKNPTDYSPDEIAFFAKKTKVLFDIFEKSADKDKTIRKPDAEQVLSARNIFSDLLRYEISDADTTLHDGEITVQFKVD